MMRLLCLLALLPLAACDSAQTCDENCQPSGGPIEVFAVNQGNFTNGDGTLGRYSAEARGVDSTAALGSILQSAVYRAGRVYVTANSAGRIDVFDAATMARVQQFAVPSPRYLAFVSDAKAYVTSQFYDFGPTVRPDIVTVVDPRSGATLDSVVVGGNAEGLAVVGTRAYVATGGFSETTLVKVIDTATDAVVQTVDVGCAPRLVLPDAEGDVFVVCAGGTGTDEVVVLDGATGAEEARIAAGTVASYGPGQEAHLAPETNELYVLRADNRVLRIDTRTNAVVATLGPFGADPVGAVAYDPYGGHLYVAHAPAASIFTAGGYVTVHTRGGAEVGRFRSGGIAPSHLVFGRTVSAP